MRGNTVCHEAKERRDDDKEEEEKERNFPQFHMQTNIPS
jgi:hypothetical protein